MVRDRCHTDKHSPDSLLFVPCASTPTPPSPPLSSFYALTFTPLRTPLLFFLPLFAYILIELLPTPTLSSLLYYPTLSSIHSPSSCVHSFEYIPHSFPCLCLDPPLLFVFIYSVTPQDSPELVLPSLIPSFPSSSVSFLIHFLRPPTRFRLHPLTPVFLLSPYFLSPLCPFIHYFSFH